MYTWPDVAGVLGVLALAIVACKVQVLPKESVIAVVAAVVAYMTARTVQLKRSAPSKKDADAKPREHDVDDDSGGIVQHEHEHEHMTSGGHVVTISPGGEIRIEHTPVDMPDEPTPVEHRHPPRKRAERDVDDDRQPDTDPGVGEEE